MDPTCLVSMVLAGGGGVMVRGMANVGPVNTNHWLNATACLNNVAGHVHLFWPQFTHIPKAISSMTVRHVTTQMSSQTGFHEYDSKFSVLKWSLQSPGQNPVGTPLGCGTPGDS